MHRRLFVRCLVAAAGAMTVFTTAVATPATCSLEMHGRSLTYHRCSADVRGDGRTMFASRDEHGVLVTVLVLPVRNDAAAGRLSIANGNNTDTAFGDFHRDGRCWTNAMVRACMIRTGAE